MTPFRQTSFLLVAAGILLVVIPITADELSTTLARLEETLPTLNTVQLQELLETGSLASAFGQGESLTLAPSELIRAQMQAELDSIEFTVGTEVLFLIPDPHTEHGTENLATMLLAMRTLAGIEYQSGSRGKMETLFAESFTIDNGRGKNRIPDPVITELPSSGVAHVYQRDTTFGWNSSTITYHVDATTVHILTINDGTFSWGFIPIIPEGRLHSHLMLIRTESFMIYYANIAARAPLVGLFESQILDSFHHRLVALHGWFEAKLDR